MKHTRLWVLAACIAASPAFAQNLPAAQNAAVVNGVAIPQSRIDTLLAPYAKQASKQQLEQMQTAARTELVNREVLLQEATREGIAQQADVKAQLATVQQNVILQALVAKYMKDNPVSDADLKAKYDSLAKKYGQKHQYHVHHILVSSKAEAERLIKKLKEAKGKNFEALAKAYSKDPGSASQKGDLGWITTDAVVPAFAHAMTELKPGQFTDIPVQTQFGWHIIRVDSTRKATVPAFADIKGQLQQQLQGEKFQQWAKQLVSKAKIQYNN
jgi:peptidyl-prolyl cis-trans isomerase C